MATDKFRRKSEGIPLIFTIVDKNRVKKVKLKIKPNTIPNGLFLPDVSTEEDNITGSIGKMHGERIVTIPAIKAKTAKAII
ncbi:MAG: hypothetical protein A3B38_03290 [Candidatus Levybacteria bacterium RIFCSPLOWO2_01_FULL_36_13]|nr:MAG: hypothetical protein A2684_04235 [Candidatus Levybacteria bacterium RIFCSPHIGHO2_01_FULL_36_15b]OGH34705.1 MAG: hypothetical protein A3B38_03290 [Candidatus Levybacteria bacterium RIFCSPLOWO2_01_FULL_36_13]